MKLNSIKVCGMKSPDNIHMLRNPKINWIGFIFYPKSPRYIEQVPPKEDTDPYYRVGVFVNEEESVVLEKIKKHQLDIVQLHGDETPEYCLNLKPHVEVWKAWSLDNTFDFQILDSYLDVVSLFVFDAKGEQRGGNSIPFDWNILSQYRKAKPFLLSGGIGPESINDLKEFHHAACRGIDINSKFETSPGLKNIDLINNFIHELSN